MHLSAKVHTMQSLATWQFRDDESQCHTAAGEVCKLAWAPYRDHCHTALPALPPQKKNNSGERVKTACPPRFQLYFAKGKKTVVKNGKSVRATCVMHPISPCRYVLGKP